MELLIHGMALRPLYQVVWSPLLAIFDLIKNGTLAQGRWGCALSMLSSPKHSCMRAFIRDVI